MLVLVSHIAKALRVFLWSNEALNKHPVLLLTSIYIALTSIYIVLTSIYIVSTSIDIVLTSIDIVLTSIYIVLTSSYYPISLYPSCIIERIIAC